MIKKKHTKNKIDEAEYVQYFVYIFVSHSDKRLRSTVLEKKKKVIKSEAVYVDRRRRQNSKTPPTCMQMNFSFPQLRSS